MRPGAPERIRALLRLVRLPNTLTAFADVVAGAALAGVDPFGTRTLAAAAGSAMLYGGGVALNDRLDLDKDRQLHPDRDLAAGRIAKGTATAVSIVLLAAGLVTGFAGGAAHLLVTVMLVVAIVGYDALPDSRPRPGALLMGACRALNLARGLTLGDAGDAVLVAAPLAHLALIAIVTLVSQREDATGAAAPGRVLALLFAFPYLTPAALGLAGLGDEGTVVLAAIGGVALAGFVIRPAWETPSRRRETVKRAVFTLVIFDGLYCLAAGSAAAALLLVAFYPALGLIARAIRQRGS